MFNPNSPDVQNLLRIQQNYFGKTKTWTKLLYSSCFGFLLILVLNLFFRDNIVFTYSSFTPNSIYIYVPYYGMWLISLGTWLINLGILNLLINKYKKTELNRDMYVSLTAWSWASITFCLFWFHGTWRVMWATSFYIIASAISKSYLMYYFLNSQKKKVQKMIIDFQNAYKNQASRFHDDQSISTPKDKENQDLNYTTIIDVEAKEINNSKEDDSSSEK